MAGNIRKTGNRDENNQPAQAPAPVTGNQIAETTQGVLRNIAGSRIVSTTDGGGLGFAGLPGAGGAQQGAGAGAQGPAWLQQAQAALDAYNSGKKFEFDAASDPLYQQYQQIMTGNAQRAMEDTMGQAATLTGGYGSSYAQGVGQQAYAEQMRQLGDRALDIYDRRRAEYDAERDADYRRYLMALEMGDRAHQAERESVEDARYDAELAYGKERDTLADQRYDAELAYGKERDTLSDQRYDAELARENERYDAQQRQQAQADAYDKAMDMIDAGYVPDAQTLAAAGIDAGYAQYRATLARQQLETKLAGGAGGGSDRPGRNGDDEGGEETTPIATGGGALTMDQAMQYLSPNSARMIEQIVSGDSIDAVGALKTYYQNRTDISNKQKLQELEVLRKVFGW